MSTGVYREGSMLDGDVMKDKRREVAFTFFSLLLVLLVAQQLVFSETR